jgi:hypothetical protein
MPHIDGSEDRGRPLQHKTLVVLLLRLILGRQERAEAQLGLSRENLRPFDHSWFDFV